MGAVGRVLDWLSSSRAAKPWPKGAATCPTCGRAIAGSTRPTGKRGAARSSGLRWTRPRDDDLSRFCPIDGPIGDGTTPQPITRDEMIATAVRFAARCEAGKEMRWAKMLRNATREPRSPEIQIGHALTLLYRRGPYAEVGVEIREPELRQAIVDIVSTWPPQASTS